MPPDLYPCISRPDPINTPGSFYILFVSRSMSSEWDTWRKKPPHLQKIKGTKSEAFRGLFFHFFIFKCAYIFHSINKFVFYLFIWQNILNI